MQGYYYEPYIVPFVIGVLFLFAKIWTRFFSWISVLPRKDKKLIIINSLSIHTFKGLWEAFSEILLHLRTFYINKPMWYIHLSLAFGWFMMIAVSKIQTAVYLKSPINPPYLEIFFNKYFHFYNNYIYDSIMDFLLLFILSGLVMIILKRKDSTKFGLKANVKRTKIDIITTYSLWAIFPLRLICESFNCSVYGGGGFLTANLGELLHRTFSDDFLYYTNETSWWLYSICSAIFMVTLPFSRYLHIFAEIPLIFLRNFGVKAHTVPTTFTFLECAACSRCGLCNEVCPLIKDEITTVGAPMTMIRNVREKRRKSEVIDTCLMCGECEKICPVKIEHKIIRLGERYVYRHNNIVYDFSYITPINLKHTKNGKIGYFAGCPTHQDLYILKSITSLIKRYNSDFVFIDKESQLCCGASLESSGNFNDAKILISKLETQILSSDITTLIVNCPTCYSRLILHERLTEKVQIMFYTDYIFENLKNEVLKTDRTFVLHEPCAARNDILKMDSAKQTLSNLGTLIEPKEKVGCCGGSLSGNAISYFDRKKLADAQLLKYKKLDPNEIVTVCPSCKRLLKNNSLKTRDISEIIIEILQKQ